ncbi:MAG: NAD-dependent deacetylase [Bacillota bacterium]|jgi:NAD-dependent deacetylase|nr:NAD-dependent deacetylase [Bacillota bacterium]MDK2960790.1 NAD-dependent deacetylase [Bacillota bacterium]
MTVMENAGVKALAELLAKNKGRAVALTGAGISTESGIPDFRSPGTGLWNRIDPMEYLSADALYARPETFWKYFAEVFGPTLEAKPNAGHLALAELEEAGYITGVITQNIDGLHQKAGSRTVFEVHGHLRTVHCESCRQTYPMTEALAWLKKEPIPHCPECGGRVRPDVVLFGDMMPPAFTQAVAAVERSSLVLVVGSSLTVSPANSLAFQTHHLAIINREPTPADGRADVVIRSAAGATLSAVLKELGLA